MHTQKSTGLVLFMFTIACVVSMGTVASRAEARSEPKATNAASLVARVRAVNAGWDWIPRCANGAHWSKSDNRCKGGSKNKDRSSKHITGYGTTNQQALISRVQNVNAGWDWKPRCANGAHWSWSSNRCKGGSK